MAATEEESTALVVITILVSLVFATIATVTSLFNSVNHLRNYTQPTTQRHVVRILLIVPTYAVSSFLSFAFPPASLIFITVRDVYEAYVIYCFLMLILAWAGGEELCIHKMSAKGALRHPPPMCCIVQNLNTRFLKQVKQGTIQFVVLKPIMAFISLVLLAFGLYDHPAWQWTMGIVYNISYTLALYALFMLYLATKKCLKTHHPVRKFFAVKSIVFLTYWQSLAFQIIGLLLPVPVTVEDQQKWNSFVLSIEMCLFAVLHIHSFPWWEFSPSASTSDELLDDHDALGSDAMHFPLADDHGSFDDGPQIGGMPQNGSMPQHGGMGRISASVPVGLAVVGGGEEESEAAQRARLSTIDLEGGGSSSGGSGSGRARDGSPPPGDSLRERGMSSGSHGSGERSRVKKIFSDVGSIVRNAVDVVNVRDIVADSVHSFAPKCVVHCTALRERA